MAGRTSALIASAIVAVILMGGVAGRALAAFEKLGVDARAVALGRAFVAVSQGPFAAFYNPAGLADAEGLMLGTMYARLYPGISGDQLHYIAVASALPVWRLGYLGIGATGLNSEIYAEQRIQFSYARRMGKLRAAGNLSLLHWGSQGYQDPVTGLKDKDRTYLGLCLDVGLLFVTDVPEFLSRFGLSGEFRLGLSLANVNRPSVAASGSADARLPLDASFGIAWTRGTTLLTLAIGQSDGVGKTHGGVEFDLFPGRSLPMNTRLWGRVGGAVVISDVEGGELDAGLGIQMGRWRLDYAYTYAFQLLESGGVHRVSAVFRF